MNVIEHLAQATSPVVSFEIIPPRRGDNISDLTCMIEQLVEYRPPFIDVTSHAGERINLPPGSSVPQQFVRKRPGTLGICAVLQHKYGIDAIPHVLCRGFTREETEDFLLDLRYIGIESVLAIRGDDKSAKPLPAGRSSNPYAVNLVQQIVALNQGRFLSLEETGTPTHFCVGVAGYPEKHQDAPDMTTDICHLKEKIDAGASYVVTQMFFDNQHYFSYVDHCRRAGISVPIIPGLKVLTGSRQLTTLPSTFSLTIPADLEKEVKDRPQHVKDIGIEWAVAQIRGLYAAGVPSVHLYVMQQNIDPVHTVLKKVL